MNTNPNQDSEPACVVRGLSDAGGPVRMVTRTLALSAEGQTSLAVAPSHPSALDLLVSALVADLLAGFRREAVRLGVVLSDSELTVSAHLENPLVALGVVGEAGSAAVGSIRGTLYVSSDASEELLERLWSQALERAPVYSTLARSATVNIELKTVA